MATHVLGVWPRGSGWSGGVLLSLGKVAARHPHGQRAHDPQALDQSPLWGRTARVARGGAAASDGWVPRSVDRLAATDRLHGDSGFEFGAVDTVLAHRWEPRSGALSRLKG